MIRWTQRTAQRRAARPARGLMMAALLVMCWAAGFGDEGIGIPAASAQTVSWINPGTGDWTTPTNWSTGTVPTASADISNGGTAQINGVAVNGPNQLFVAQANNGAGSLLIQSGGSLTLGFFFGQILVANGSNASGTVTVDGPGSQLIGTQVSLQIEPGGASTGNLTVSNGGLVNIASIDLAPGGTGTATANVNGPGSQLIVDSMTVSRGGGHGTLNISAGGTASVRNISIGFDEGAVGAVNVDGTGSSVTATSFIFGAGVSSRGTLTLSNGGTAVSGATIVVGSGGGTAAGTINIGAAPGSVAVAPGSVTAPAVNLVSSTSVINFNHTATNYSFAPDITGLGSVAVYSGTTALTGTNTYTGATSVSGGTLRGGAANAFSAASATTVNAGGTVDLGGFAQTINTVALAGGALSNGSLTGTVTSTGGGIGGLGGSMSLVANGGTTTISAANTYTGATIIAPNPSPGTAMPDRSEVSRSASPGRPGSTVGLPLTMGFPFCRTQPTMPSPSGTRRLESHCWSTPLTNIGSRQRPFCRNTARLSKGINPCSRA